MAARDARRFLPPRTPNGKTARPDRSHSVGGKSTPVNCFRGLVAAVWQSYFMIIPMGHAHRAKPSPGFRHASAHHLTPEDHNQKELVSWRYRNPRLLPGAFSAGRQRQSTSPANRQTRINHLPFVWLTEFPASAPAREPCGASRPPRAYARCIG